MREGGGRPSAHAVAATRVTQGPLGRGCVKQTTSEGTHLHEPELALRCT